MAIPHEIRHNTSLNPLSFNTIMDSTDLKKSGLKVTLPRRLILELLENSDQRHLSAEDAYRMLLERGENIGIATVYRVLAQFEAAGLVERHQFDGTTSVFELTPETHHDHLICTACGTVIEFSNEKIETLQHKIASQAGLEITGHSLQIYGTCKDPEQCLKNREKKG